MVPLRGLPLDHPGCSVIRLLAEPRTAQEAAQPIRALQEDPAVLASTKRSLLEGIEDLEALRRRVLALIEGR